MQTSNQTEQNNQRLIREALKKIVLGRSLERISMAPSGTSGIGTARMIHGYVAKIHDDPNDPEYEDYAGTIDVGEFPDETASIEPAIHKGVLLSGLKNNVNGFLVVPTLFSDVTIITDAATTHAYVVNYSHANFLQFDAHDMATIGATETEALDLENNDSPDYDELEKTGNASNTTYTPFSINTFVASKDGKRADISVSSSQIKQTVGGAELTHTDEGIEHKVGSTGIKVSDQRITIGDDNATEPLVLGNELAQLMLEFLTECSKITTPTLMGTMPALNIPNFTALTSKINLFLSKTSFTK